MQRDMDHLRDLMLRIDGAGGDGFDSQDLPDKDLFHLALLDDAGFIRYSAKYLVIGKRYHNLLNVVLTFQGYEYIDSIRKDAIWQQVKDKASEKGLPLVLDVVKQIAALLLKNAIQAA